MVFSDGNSGKLTLFGEPHVTFITTNLLFTCLLENTHRHLRDEAFLFFLEPLFLKTLWIL
jgi:hypothetical protein